jgi:hypothetical protein
MKEEGSSAPEVEGSVKEEGREGVPSRATPHTHTHNTHTHTHSSDVYACPFTIIVQLRQQTHHNIQYKKKRMIIMKVVWSL